MLSSNVYGPEGSVLRTADNRDVLAEQAAASVAGCLRERLAQAPAATLLVSGGRTPITLFEHLAVAELDWSRVTVSLVDERWVDEDDEHSNAALVRRYLLQEQAAEARFVPLYRGDSPQADAEQASAFWQRHEAGADVVILGMGLDGHTGSLFADSPNLVDALALDGPPCLVMQAPQEPRTRLAIGRSVLSQARLTVLLIEGEDKLKVLRQACGDSEQLLPIRAFLTAPIEIFWCP